MGPCMSTQESSKVGRPPGKVEKFWVGKWKYRSQHKDNFFQIVVKRGELVYSETFGASKVVGRVHIEDSGDAHITCKSLRFEIRLSRKSLSARFKKPKGGFGPSIKLKR